MLDKAIARTAKVDPHIDAVVVKHYDYAERQIEKGLPEGPFTGVPFLLKDLDLGARGHVLSTIDSLISWRLGRGKSPALGLQ